MLELVCLDEDIECVELQEPIQVDLNSVDNKGDELLEDHKVLTLCEEDLPPPRERSCLAQPKIDESMSEVFAYSSTTSAIIVCHISIHLTMF